MSFKKTVTFTAKVSDYTDGTVTARIQAENSIVNQIAAWLIVNMPTLQQLEKIEIGASNWSGWPFYAVNSSVPSSVTNYLSLSAAEWRQLTDVFILGKNKNNWTVALTADCHVLRFAPCCSVEFQTALNQSTTRDLSIPIAQVRKHRYVSDRQVLGGAIDLFTFPTTGDDVTIALDYWKSADTLIFSVRGYSDFVLFSKGESDGFGYSTASNTVSGKYMIFDLNEPMQANERTQTATDYNAASITTCLLENYGMSYDPIYWGNMSSYSNFAYSRGASYALPPIGSHELIFVNKLYKSMLTERIAFWEIDACLPRINSDELYLKKVYHPNTRNTAPVKFAYTPGYLAAKSVYGVNSKYYLCLGNGWASYLIEVADQGE